MLGYRDIEKGADQNGGCSNRSAQKARGVMADRREEYKSREITPNPGDKGKPQWQLKRFFLKSQRIPNPVP